MRSFSPKLNILYRSQTYDRKRTIHAPWNHETYRDSRTAHDKPNRSHLDNFQYLPLNRYKSAPLLVPKVWKSTSTFRNRKETTQSHSCFSQHPESSESQKRQDWVTAHTTQHGYNAHIKLFTNHTLKKSKEDTIITENTFGIIQGYANRDLVASRL